MAPNAEISHPRQRFDQGGYAREQVVTTALSDDLSQSCVSFCEAEVARGTDVFCSQGQMYQLPKSQTVPLLRRLRAYFKREWFPTLERVAAEVVHGEKALLLHRSEIGKGTTTTRLELQSE